MAIDAPNANAAAIQSLAPTQANGLAKTTPTPSVQPEGDASAHMQAIVQPEFKVNEKFTISTQDLQAAVDRLNQSLKEMNRDVNFSVDSSTGKDVVRVFNSNTGELVRQLPNDETLNFVKNLENMMGMIFDNKS
jgi:flagellar protein FlaG